MRSEASRRKRRVCCREGRGVVGFWVERKVLSQAGEGGRDLVLMRCVVRVLWRLGWEDMVGERVGGCRARNVCDHVD